MMTNEEVACVGECVTHKSTSNTVEIRVTRENVVTLGSSTPPPFPTPHLLLNSIVSFDYHSMYSLLYPTLEDPTLCTILSCTVATEAKRVPGPLYISFHVTLKPEILLFDVEEGEIDTCAICLEEERNLCPLPNCSHVFHYDCIDKWLVWSNNCPLCRAEILDDGDYDETNS